MNQTAAQQDVLDPKAQRASPRAFASRSAGLCLAVALLVGCGGGGGISGDWGGDGCIYQKMTFQRGGKVLVTPVLFGMELPTSEARYEVNGDRVTISTPEDGRAVTFTREGNTLRGGGLIGNCVKL